MLKIKNMTEKIFDKKTDFRIIRADKDDAKTLKKSMAEAFINDPMIDWLTKQDPYSFERKEYLFENIIKKFTSRNGYVFADKNLSGCSVWVQNNDEKNPFSEFNSLFLYVKVSGLKKIPDIMRASSIIDKLRPKVPFLYLISIGITPEMQGKGLGNALLEPGLEICDRDNLPAYLETSNKNNIAFFEKYGFKVQHEILESRIIPDTWTMFRKSKLEI